LLADLAALRDAAGRLAAAAAAGQPTDALDHERRRLERAVRTRSLRTASDPPGRAADGGTPARASLAMTARRRFPSLSSSTSCAAAAWSSWLTSTASC